MSLPAWVFTSHPIVEQETRRWRTWRYRRWLTGCLLAALVLLPAACGAVTLLISLSPAELDLQPPDALLIAGAVAGFAAWTLASLVSWLAGLMAAVLGATLIARERESQTWTFLQLTPLTPAEIFGGKLASLFHNLGGLVAGALALRAAALLIWLIITVAGGLRLPPDALSEIWAELSTLFGQPLPWLDLLAAALSVLLGLALVIGGGLAEPYYAVLYNGVLGLAVSAFVRTRAGAVIVVFAVHFILGVAVYWPAQQALSLMLMLPLISQPQLASPWPVLAISLLQVLVILVLQAGAMALAAVFGVRRLEAVEV